METDIFLELLYWIKEEKLWIRKENEKKCLFVLEIIC